jgi:hypothetical protein
VYPGYAQANSLKNANAQNARKKFVAKLGVTGFIQSKGRSDISRK